MNRSCNGSWGDFGQAERSFRTEAERHSGRIPDTIGGCDEGIAEKEAVTPSCFQDNRPSTGKSNAQKTSKIEV
jgi:hypothetical protein